MRKPKHPKSVPWCTAEDFKDCTLYEKIGQVFRWEFDDDLHEAAYDAINLASFLLADPSINQNKAEWRARVWRKAMRLLKYTEIYDVKD